MFGLPVPPHPQFRMMPTLIGLFVGVVAFAITLQDSPAFGKSSNTTPAAATALSYIKAIETGTFVSAGKLDFACQYQIMLANEKGTPAFPEKSSPIYQQCWETIDKTSAEFVMDKDLGMNMLWPGPGKLLFLGVDLNRFPYPPSTFVSQRLGKTSTGGGFKVRIIKEKVIPPASFRLQPQGDILAAPATLLHVGISYLDPLSAPASYASGTYQWVTPVDRPRAIIKDVTIKMVVLSNLKKLGFPGDRAVVNLLAVEAEGNRPAIPLLAENSGYLNNSAAWWTPKDVPDNLVAAIGQAASLKSLAARVSILNRVLLIDPNQADALTSLSRDLYQGIMDDGAANLPVKIKEKVLANRFLEFYWDTYAAQERMDISLGMEMGGFSKPTTADYLFRMIPAMQKLQELRPEDLENRFRLGIAYRWNLDQLIAIVTHEALVKDLPPERGALRARALLESAWSKITKVAFNRMFDDPVIREAHQEAKEALTLSTKPLDKFAATYTMAYSLVYTPDRDNKAILAHLTQAKEWYFQVKGSSPESWRVLVENETLKPLFDADPSFKQLVAAR